MSRFIGMVIVAAIVALALWACDSAMQAPVPAGSPPDDRANVLRFDVQAPFGTLDPTVVSASGSNNVFPLLYSCLFVPGKAGTLEPDLAIRWDFDAERLTWTIALRQDARFHNGRPVTAQDVKYSVDSLIENVHHQFCAIIDDIACLSATTVGITLKRNDPLFLQSIWSVAIRPAPDGQADDFYHHPIGSGPFVFKSREGNDEVILEANAHYYAGRPSLDRIVFSYQPDREKTWTRLLRGETDIASEIIPLNYKMTKQYQDRFYFDRYILPYHTIFLYNTHDPLFADPMVRRALAHAIDREYIVREILQEFGVVASGPMGVRSPFRHPDLKPVPYDPPKAVALLEAAGWSHDPDGRLVFSDGTPFGFTLLVFRESQIEKTVARYMQLCLDEIGIQMQIKLVPFDELTQTYYRNTDFQVVLTEIQTANSDYYSLMQAWVPDSSGCSILGCFQDAEATRMLTEAFQTRNPERQRFLLQAFDSRIMSLQPGTFLFQKTAIDVMSKRFRLSAPFSLRYQGICSLRHASLVPNS